MKKAIWLILILITSISLGVTFFAPINEIYKGIAVLPSVGALFAALFQLLRDSAAYERSIKLQEEQQLFNLGATSHMANTVFDKHVEFCEKYLSEVHQLVITLTKEGPTKNALDHAGNLYTLRIEYTAWITPEIEDRLLPFEKAVRKIGANAGLADSLRGEEDRQGVRSKALKDMYDIFSSLMDFQDVDVVDEEATIKVIKNRVREILQVSDLVKVREYLVTKAADVAANK